MITRKQVRMSNYLSKVKTLISERYGVAPEEINGESFIEEDLNIGEIDLMELLTELEEIYKIEFPEDKENIKTINDIIDVILESVD